MPVLVVGAGPVGQTAAALLARWGMQVMLFDQRPARDAIGSKALCQARDVLDVWDTVGVGRRLASEGTAWTRARTFYRDREIARWEFRDRGTSPFPAVVNIGQQRTEELLDDALVASRVRTYWGHRLIAVAQDENAVQATFDANGVNREVHGSHMVVATGARSDEIREWLGLRFDGETFDDHFLICDIRTELPGWQDERRFYFDPAWNPDRQVLIHPCPQSTYRIDWQVPDGFDLDVDIASGGLDRRIRAIVGDRPFEIIWKSVYRFHSRSVNRFCVGRILLAGDVAHLVSPFGARGLNTGVYDAENAAWKIAFDVRGWAGPGLLESYHDERFAATLENLEVTTATMRFLVPQTGADRAARRELLEAAAADPAVAARIDSGRFTEPFWYVDSPLTTPDGTRPFAGRPPKGATPRPGPGILMPDGPIAVPGNSAATHLRRLLRDGFSVIVRDRRHQDAVLATVTDLAPVPTQLIVLESIEGGEVVADVLGCMPDDAWVVRPDAHIAAVVNATEGAALSSALRRALGY